MNLNNIKRIMRRGRILENEPMSKHTTFRVGGPARYYLIPSTEAEAAGIIRYLHLNGIEHYVIGNGSNLLVSDAGYPGVIVDFGRHDGTYFTQLGIDDSGDPVRFDAGAGCLLSAVGKYAQQFGGSGFEGLAGIPGTIGGACAMNAGAFGAEMKDVLVSIDVLTSAGEHKKLRADEVRFGYRSTSLMEDGYIILRAELALKKDDPAAIRQRMDEFLAQRKEKQPLEYPSAGSTFKRPEGHYAGKLIEEAGLRGFSIGGAAVSEKHCGFLINKENASAADIYQLIQAVQDKVEQKTGVRLEPEVRMLGKF